MPHQLAIVVSNLPWWRRGARRWRRAAGSQGWGLDRPIRLTSMGLGCNTEAMRSNEQILHMAED